MELFGYESESYVPHIDSFSVRLHPDDRERTEAAIARAIDGCGDYEADYRVVHPDGSVRWVAARGRVLCDPDGRPARMLGAAYDTTDVHSAAERLGRVLETMSTAFFTLDRDWRFTYLNAEAERILGRRRDELIGEVIWEALRRPRGHRVRRSTTAPRWRAASRRSFEQYYPPLDTHFDVRATPNDDGLSVYFHDISNRVRAEQRARGGAGGDRRRDRAPADPQRGQRAAGGHARGRRAAADPRRRRAQRLRRRARRRARRARAGRVAQPGDPDRARDAPTTRPAPCCSRGWRSEPLMVERFGARTAIVADLIPALAGDALGAPAGARAAADLARADARRGGRDRRGRERARPARAGRARGARRRGARQRGPVRLRAAARAHAPALAAADRAAVAAGDRARRALPARRRRPGRRRRLLPRARARGRPAAAA